MIQAITLDSRETLSVRWDKLCLRSGMSQYNVLIVLAWDCWDEVDSEGMKSSISPSFPGSSYSHSSGPSCPLSTPPGSSYTYSLPGSSSTLILPVLSYTHSLPVLWLSINEFVWVVFFLVTFLLRLRSTLESIFSQASSCNSGYDFLSYKLVVDFKKKLTSSYINSLSTQPILCQLFELLPGSWRVWIWKILLAFRLIFNQSSLLIPSSARKASMCNRIFSVTAGKLFLEFSLEVPGRNGEQWRIN